MSLYNFVRIMNILYTSTYVFLHEYILIDILLVNFTVICVIYIVRLCFPK